MNTILRPDMPAFIQIILGICILTLCILLLMAGSALIEALRDYLFTSHADEDDETDYDDDSLYASTEAETKRRAWLHHLLMCGSIDEAKPLVEVWQWSPKRQAHVLVGVKMEDESSKVKVASGKRARLHPLDRNASIFEKAAEEDNLSKLNAELDAEAIAAAKAQHGLVDDPDDDALPPLTKIDPKPLPAWLKACADEVKAKTSAPLASLVVEPPTARIERPLTTAEAETLDRIHKQHESDQYHAQRAREKRLSEQNRRDSAAEMESGWPAMFEGSLQTSVDQRAKRKANRDV